MAANQIPIQNIYYLLCYAWGHLQEKQYAQVRSENCDKIWDLLAKMMIRSSQQLVKRGLHRDYVLRRERRVRLKGKILVSHDVRRPVLSSLARTCEFDELDSDVLPNQIIAATFAILSKHPELNDKNRREVRESLAVFAHCTSRRLKRSDFRRVRINRNMRHYRFILSVCELIYTQSMGNTESGEVRFRDFDRDEASMGLLFEAFVRNFFDKEQSAFRVSAPQVKWDLDETQSSAGGLKLLPTMNTDICLQSESSKLIIDCKFYKNMFSRYYDSKKMVSANLYQLFCYLKNQSSRKGWESVRGMLLYPTLDESIDEYVHVQGHEIRVATINLAQDWSAISDDLLQLIDPI